jgi:hypothetical protein
VRKPHCALIWIKKKDTNLIQNEVYTLQKNLWMKKVLFQEMFSDCFRNVQVMITRLMICTWNTQVSKDVICACIEKLI